ncbi:hypothetical protein JCM10213_007565 [Rhodosporidiobolus nylandii]
MGCSQSAALADTQQLQVSKKIDDELKAAKREAAIETRALLLGPGESGKSTVCKQMRLCYAQPYSHEERLSYREIVFANTVQSAQAVLTSGFPSHRLSIPLFLRSTAEFLLSLEADAASAQQLSGAMRPDVAEALELFWAAEETRKVVRGSGRFQLNDSAAYFFDALPRLSSPSYVPTTDDVLRTRVRSTGVKEEVFDIKQLGRKILVVDVGGQRSERKKWIHCFENVNILLFVIAISEYPQMLYEDETINRLDESAQLWESIAASRWFAKSSFVLFLNKLDLFTEKMTSDDYPLSKYMSDFSGEDGNVAHGKGFMKAKFTALKRDQGRALYCTFTCATDTEATKIVLASVMNSVLTSRLEEVGLM